MTLASINDVNAITLPFKQDSLGKLIIAEVESSLPIDISRVFVVHGELDAIRGKHAHKALTQIFVCLSGMCDVVYDDGATQRKIQLDLPEKALVVPPGIWTMQHYLGSASILMVLCDLPYDESDYIRDYDQFLAYRKSFSQ